VVFEECDNAREVIVIPSIVLIESLFLCEKYKVNLKFEEVLLKLSLSPNYTIHPLNEEVILECAKLKLPDPHDRIIAATALLLGVPLITRDEKIRETKGIDTIWD